MGKQQFSRRDFLRRSAVAAAGAGVAIGGIGAGCGLAQEKAPLKQRVLGRTELKVTEIAFGGTRLDNREALNYGIDRGINFIHTNPDYNRGKAFPEYCAVTKQRREQVVLGLKLHPNEAQLDDALPFSEGLAPVKVGTKWGYIRNPLEKK